MAIASSAGQLVSNLGGALNLPEFGISERISSIGQQPSGLDYSAPLNVALQEDRARQAADTSLQSTTDPFASTARVVQGGQVPTGVNMSTEPLQSIGQPAQTTTTAPSDTRVQQLQKIDRNPAQQTELDRLLASINQQGAPDFGAQFQPIFDVLGKAEANLRAQQPGLIQEAEAQAQASRGLLTGERESAEALLGQQRTQTESQRARQVATQRQLLQELQQANQARFGGASSAGLAASELQGREFQRSRFGIQEGAQQALQSIGNRLQDVNRTFQQGLQQLEVNKQQAVNGINRKFQDRLLEIDARRGETESAKAQARIGALQELRNRAFQINVAKAQFEQDLRAQAQQNTQSLSGMASQLTGFGQEGQAATDQFGATTPTGISSVQGGPIQGSSATDPRFANFQPTGQISRDDLVGQIGTTPLNLTDKFNFLNL